MGKGLKPSVRMMLPVNEKGMLDGNGKDNGRLRRIKNPSESLREGMREEIRTLKARQDFRLKKFWRGGRGEKRLSNPYSGLVRSSERKKV